MPEKPKAPPSPLCTPNSSPGPLPQPSTLTLDTPPKQILSSPAQEVITLERDIPPLPSTDPHHMKRREIHSMLDSLNGLTLRYTGMWGRYSRTLGLVVETQHNTYRATAKIILQDVRGRKHLSWPEWSATAGRTVSERRLLLQKLLETLQAYASAFKSGSILMYRLHQEIEQAYNTLKKCVDSVDEKAHRLVTVSHTRAKEIAREVMDALDVEVDPRYDMLTCLPKKPTRTKFALPAYCDRDGVWHHDTTCVVVAKVPADSFDVWWYPDNLDAVRERIRAMIPYPNTNTTPVTPETLWLLNRCIRSAKNALKTIGRPYRYIVAVCTSAFTTLNHYPFLALTMLKAKQWAVYTGGKVSPIADTTVSTHRSSLKMILECAIAESMIEVLAKPAWIDMINCRLSKETARRVAEVGMKKLRELRNLVGWRSGQHNGLDTRELMIPELLVAGMHLSVEELDELGVLDTLRAKLEEHVTVNTHVPLSHIPLQISNSYLRAVVTALLPAGYLNSETTDTGYLKMIEPYCMLKFWKIIAKPLRALEKKDVSEYHPSYRMDVAEIIEKYREVMDRSLGTVTF